MCDCIDSIKSLENLFSNNQYFGSGESAFVIEEGTIPIMVSAPHAIHHFREGIVKKADIFTGGIARYLHRMTGCHIIYSCKYTKTDPNYDPVGFNKYQEALFDFLQNHKVYVLLDIHGASSDKKYALEMGTAPNVLLSEEDPSLHNKKFISDIIKTTMEKEFENCDTDRKSVWKNVIFNAGMQNTVTKFISENTNTSCVQLEINGVYRNVENRKEFLALITAFIKLITKLNSIDFE